jgi:hypothetical protein
MSAYLIRSGYGLHGYVVGYYTPPLTKDDEHYPTHWVDLRLFESFGEAAAFVSFLNGGYHKVSLGVSP